MASRTISTGDDVESALAFLAKQKGSTADSMFMEAVATVMKKFLADADEQRYKLATEALKETDHGKAVSKLRELLGA